MNVDGASVGAEAPVPATAPPGQVARTLPAAPQPWQPRRGNLAQTLGWALLGLANARVAAQAAQGYIGARQQRSQREIDQYNKQLPIWQRQQEQEAQTARWKVQDAETAAYHDQMAQLGEDRVKAAEYKTRLAAGLKHFQELGVAPIPAFMAWADDPSNNPYPFEDMQKLKPATGSAMFGRIGNVEGKILGVQAGMFGDNPTPGNLDAIGLTTAKMRGVPYTFQSGANNTVEFDPRSIFTGREDKHAESQYNQNILADRHAVLGDPRYIASAIKAPGLLNNNRQAATQFLLQQPNFTNQRLALTSRGLELQEKGLEERIRDAAFDRQMQSKRLGLDFDRLAIERWKAHNPTAKATGAKAMTSQLSSKEKILLGTARQFGAKITTDNFEQVLSDMSEMERKGIIKFPSVGYQGKLDYTQPPAVSDEGAIQSFRSRYSKAPAATAARPTVKPAPKAAPKATPKPAGKAQAKPGITAAESTQLKNFRAAKGNGYSMSDATKAEDYIKASAAQKARIRQIWGR